MAGLRSDAIHAHQARDSEQRGDDRDPRRTRNVDRRRDGASRGATTDAGTTTSAGEGCRSSLHFGQVVGGVTLQLDEHDCGLVLRACGSIGVTAVPGPCSVRCCCTADLRTVCASDGVTGLSIRRSTMPAESRLIRPLLIAGAADGDDDERGLCLAQPLRHAPQGGLGRESDR